MLEEFTSSSQSFKNFHVPQKFVPLRFICRRPGLGALGGKIFHRALLLAPPDECDGDHYGRDQSEDAQHWQIGEEQAHGCNGESCHDHAF